MPPLFLRPAAPPWPLRFANPRVFVCQKPVLRRASRTSRMQSSATDDTSSDPTVADHVLQAASRLRDDLADLSFESPVAHVYNPLQYAWSAHQWYVRRYCRLNTTVLLVGMNPGPWGMAQTAVPFGEVNAVRHYLQMPDDLPISSPAHPHPKRPVDGLSCARSEVSGNRLWLQWAQTHYPDPDHFFDLHFVYNYCPLMFLEASAKNRTPVQLPVAQRRPLERLCDLALAHTVFHIRPKVVCAVGNYAARRCQLALEPFTQHGLLLGTVLHPSPASPAANRGWAPIAADTIQNLTSRASHVHVDWDACHLP